MNFKDYLITYRHLKLSTTKCLHTQIHLIPLVLKRSSALHPIQSLALPNNLRFVAESQPVINDWGYLSGICDIFCLLTNIIIE